MAERSALLRKAGSMLFILLLWNILIPAWVVYRACLTRRGLEVNHLFTFSSGFVLYGIFPIALGSVQIEVPFPGADTFYEVFERVPLHALRGYLAFCAVGYLAFLGGSLSSLRLVQLPRHVCTLVFDSRLLYAALIAALGPTAILLVRLRSELFTGYTTLEGFGGGLRGSLVAVSLVLLSLALLYGARCQHRLGEAWRLYHLLRTPFFAAYALVTVLVLSLGSRLYLVSCVLIILTYLSCYVHRVRLRHAGGILLCTVVIVGLAGLWRLGLAASMTAAAAGLLAEPLLVSLSLLAFLEDMKVWLLLRLPWMLLYDFVNLLPTILFPAKEQWLLSPEALGYTIYSPFGAVNATVLALINFGVLGTLVGLFAIGFGMQSLRTRSAGPLSRTIYAMLTGWLGFTFFRDPFSVSLVKSMFQFSVMTPIIVVLALHMITQAVRGGLRVPLPLTLKPAVPRPSRAETIET